MLWIAVLAERIIWGVACVKILKNKGYYDVGAWFVWGFLFGLIALVVALTKPEKKSYYENTYYQSLGIGGENRSIISKEIKKQDDSDILKNGGWKCKKCGRVNRVFVGTCSCGMDKEESLNSKDSNEKNNDYYSELTSLKELLDKGVITQEDFDAKKKQILGL